MSGTCKLFVGSLPTTLADDVFRQLFEGFGTVVDYVLKPEKRYGFVTYGTVEEAQRALENMQGYEIEGARFDVKFADHQQRNGGGAVANFGSGGNLVPPSLSPFAAGGGAGASQWDGNASALPKTERLYCKMLPAGLQAEDIRTLFAPLGQVQDVHILTSSGVSDDGLGQTVAIVKMSSVPEAEYVLESMNGAIPDGCGRPILVSYAEKKAAPAPGWAAPGAPGGAGGRYAPYAPPVVAAPRPVPPPGKGPQQLGMPPQGQRYAAPPPASQYAGPALLPGTSTQARIGDVLLPNAVEMLKTVEPNSKLYVKHLPFEADDLYLYKVFAPFGAVLSAKVLKKEGYAIGFVQYAYDAEAAGAITGVNGTQLLDGNVLNVSVKTSAAGGGK